MTVNITEGTCSTPLLGSDGHSLRLPASQVSRGLGARNRWVTAGQPQVGRVNWA